MEIFEKMMRYALFGANCIILICGIAVLAVGAKTLAGDDFMERLMGTGLYSSSARILVAAGVTVTIISFLGCYGAIKGVKWMLAAYFLILLIIFITMLIGGILGYVFRSEVGKQMKQEMISTIPLYMNDTIVTDAWDAVQQHFKCCGLSLDTEPSYRIWLKNPNFTETKQVPQSCCKKKDEVSIIACQIIPQINAYTEDCYVKMKEFAKGHALVLGGIGIGISCVLIVGMIFSCCLFLIT